MRAVVPRQKKKKKREGFVVDEKLIVESVYNGG